MERPSLVPRSSAPLLLAALLLAVSSCAAAEPRQEATRAGLATSIARLAEDLVGTAERRTDLRGVRIAIQGFRARDAAAAPAPGEPAAKGDPIEDELVRELVLALANRVHLIDLGLEGDEAPGAARGTPRVTHLILGEYELRGESLDLAARLVDADSHVILAAARGSVPVGELGALARPPAAAPPAASVVAARALSPTPRTRPVLRSLPQGREALVVREEPAAPRPEPARLVLPPAPSEPLEDFQTWLARRRAAEAQIQRGEAAGPPPPDAAPAAEPAPAEGSGSPGPASARTGLPWRTPELSELLRVPAPGAPRPWRTPELAELLRVGTPPPAPPPQRP